MILFGIRDKTGEIIGLSYQEIQQINSMLANIATNLLRPVTYIQTETIIIEDRSILVAHIDEGDNKPYKDLGGAIWIKQGSDKRRVMENSEIIRYSNVQECCMPMNNLFLLLQIEMSTVMYWMNLCVKNMGVR